MNCHDALPLLGPSHDGELDAAQQTALDQHLASCAACRAESALLAQDDGWLRQDFAARTARVIAATEAALAGESTPESRPLATPAAASSHTGAAAPASPRWRSWLTHLACVAAGFALAILMLEPTPAPVKPPDRGGVSRVVAPVSPPPVASLTVATGPVEYRTPDLTEWTACVPGFVCPSDVSLRTNDALCELKTEEEGIVRLDRATELDLPAAGRLVLRRGKVWCRVPEGKQIEVRAESDEKPIEGDVLCKGTGATWSAGFSERHFECLSSAGSVVVETGATSLRLEPGKVVRVGGGFSPEPVRVDQIASVRWMWPLLVRHGPDNPELNSQVHALLATLGRTKVAYLNELEIRQLGEYGAVPVLRFVQSADPRESGQQREAAMRILADVAPISFVPAMIDLLADSSPGIRVLAARTLLRLTGETHGRRPEDWANPISADDDVLASWRVWRDQNRSTLGSGD